METKFFMYAIVAYIIITFVMAAGWHLVLFKRVYDRLGVFTRKKPIIPLGLTSMLLQALVVAYAYPIFVASGNSVTAGVWFGLLFIGVFMGSNAVLGEAGKNEVGSIPAWVMLESAYYLIHGAVVGLALWLIY